MLPCQVSSMYTMQLDNTVWQQQTHFEGLKVSPISVKIKEKLNQCNTDMPFVRTNTALCPVHSLLYACKYVMQLPCKNYLISCIILCIFCNFLYMFTKLTYQLINSRSQQNLNGKIQMKRKKIFIKTNHLYIYNQA